MKNILAFGLLAILAAPVAAQQCSIEYQRADNSFAAPGRPDGQLGVETLTLKPGETKVFNTDWKYEKRRNDGTNYYGSHLRIIRNTGPNVVKLAMRGADKISGIATQVTGQRAVGELQPGQSANQLRHDLMEVTCGAGDKTASTDPKGNTPGGTPNPASTPPPSDLRATPTRDTVQLTWVPVPNAKEYRVYVVPSPYTRPGVVSGTGRSFVIPVPRNVDPSTVYQASIETVGQDGSVSPRVSFPPVPARAVLGMGGGPGPLGGGPTSGGGTPSPGGPSTSPSTPTTSGAAGQQCPPGQFVTGFTSTGAVICAAPR